jgi:hypothetical protein
MNRLIGTVSLLGLCSLAACLAACGPPDLQYVNWAPDGRRAYAQSARVAGKTWVVSQMLVDSGGKSLSAHVRPNEGVIAWMPDSEHVIVARREIPPSDWDDYARALGPTRSSYVEASASELVAMVEGNAGGWKAFDSSPAMRAWLGLLGSLDITAQDVMYYLQQTRPASIAPLVHYLQAASDSRDNSMVLDKSVLESPTLVELRLRNASAASDAGERLISRATGEIWWAAPSPDGGALVFETDSPALYVASLRVDKPPVYIGRPEDWSGHAAWSPDGQYVAYVQAGEDVGLITRMRICAPNGDVIQNPEPGEALARASKESPARVAWLPDGRIVFTSAATLPAIASARSKGSTFYALRFQPTVAVERMVSEPVASQLPEDVDDFVVSPDGRKVAIYGGSAVSVLFVDAGKYVSLQDGFDPTKYEGWPVDVPAWRNSDELSYLVPAGAPGGSRNRVEIVVTSLKDGTRHVISKSWPDSSLLPPLKGN